MGTTSDQLARLVRRFRVAQSEVDPCSGTNHEIFTEIFNLLHPILRDYACSLSGDNDSAEDLAGQALMKLYQNAGSIDPDKTISWSMKVVLNSFRSLWRKERHFCNMESVSERYLARNTEAVFAEDRVLESIAVQQALDDLPSLEKKIVEKLRCGHSVIEVAKQCGKHRVTIYRHLDSIKQKLIERLGGETVGEFRIPTVS